MAFEARSVFPTHVGVFLSKPAASPACWRLPHARGGVSIPRIFSTARCAVFPTHVGVFPN